MMQGKKKKSKSFRLRHKDAITATIILTPMLLWWIISAGFPTGFGFLLGFLEWKGVNATPQFVGLKNFVTFFSSEYYMSVLWRTVWLGVTCTLLNVAGGFGIALLMNMKIKAKGIYRSLWYMPAVVSTVAVTQILGIFLNPMYGYINNLLASSGKETIVLATSTKWNLILIIVYNTWKGIGGMALVWLAGLQGVDPLLYEAATVDGANAWNKFRHVTIPGLKPMITYVTITSIIGALQIYEPVAFISNGGPNRTTMVLALQSITEGYFNFDFGMSGACAMVMAIIVFAVTVPYYTIVRKRQNQD